MAASVLMAGALKFEGRLSLQFEGRGALRLMLAQCTHRHALRGVARHDDIPAGTSGISLFGGGQLAKREQTIAQALREAFKYPSFQLLMAGYFVCGFQVVFIGVHMPSYLKDKGLSPQVASYALALIGLFNVFGTYIAGSLGQKIAKRKILATIYLSRAIVIAVWRRRCGLRQLSRPACFASASTVL